MASISLKNIIKRYGSGKHAVQVLDGVSAEIADREFIVIVGPSGPVPATDRADGLVNGPNRTSFGGFSCPLSLWERLRVRAPCFDFRESALDFPTLTLTLSRLRAREQVAEARTLTLMARRQTWAKWQA